VPFFAAYLFWLRFEHRPTGAVGVDGTAAQNGARGNRCDGPFLTIHQQGRSQTESGYNTNGFAGMYLDQTRPQWNQYLRFGDLATITIGNSTYFAFQWDANEPANGKSLLSIDNIRIYTSSSDNTAAVGNDEGNLDALGTLRYAMNNPLKIGPNYEIDNWIKLDVSQPPGPPNGGSGVADMIFLRACKRVCRRVTDRFCLVLQPQWRALCRTRRV